MKSKTQQGFTLVESIIVLAITAFLIGVVSSLITSSGDSQAYAQRLARATEVNQEILNDMRTELLSSVSLFQGGRHAKGYFDACAFDKQAIPLNSTRLPTVQVSGTFGKEKTAGSRTGNALLLASQAWTTEFQCTSGNIYLIDVYRFKAFYLTPAGPGPQPGSATGLNLAKFASEPIADGNQIDSIQDPVDKTEMLAHLLGLTPDLQGTKRSPVQLVWTRGLPYTDIRAIRQIDPLTHTLSATPVAPRPLGPWRFRLDPKRSTVGLLHYRYFSAVTNYGHKRFGVARFGKRDNTGDGFPHGLEIQIRGPSMTRQVLLHLGIVSTNNHGTKGHSDLRATIMVQDL